MKAESRICQNCRGEFIIEPDDFNFYEKIKVPAPTWCPECRLIRRLIWRNDRYLSKVNCKLCGDSTFSLLSEDSGYDIYCVSCWVSDRWNPLDYGQEYDFSKPFLEQFEELFKKVPIRARFSSSSSLINSDYTNYVSNLKNCYLIYNSDYDENCMYGSEIENSRDCVDNTMIDGCEQSSGNVNCQKCYKTFFSTDCMESSDVWFSHDLIGCLNCFGCVGLRNKNYYIFNQPYSREDYQETIKEFSLGDFKNLAKIESKVKEIYLKIPRRYVHGRQNTNTTGDYIYNSKDVKNSYIAIEAQNCKYSMWLIVPTVKDCWDYTEYGDKAEQIYETITAGKNVSKIKFSDMIAKNAMDIEYSYCCQDTQNLFGCVGLRKKQYCILNKRYTKKEYEELVPTIRKRDLPDSVKNVPDSFVNEIIECCEWGSEKSKKQNCTKAFRVTANELSFYRKHNIPLPRKCPNCRHYDRIQRRNSITLWHRFCMCDKKHSHHEGNCDIEFETSYAPDRPEIVYCEKCYQQEIY